MSSTRRHDRPGAKQEKYPALHPSEKFDLQFIRYQPPPCDGDPASQEEWLQRVNILAEDLHYVLSLPHENFWCQVIHDETLERSISSYLQHAPRDHDPVYHQSSKVSTKQEEIHRLYFLVCLRMATYKESKDHYFAPSVHGEIIYENFIFDVPKIMDLCVLYGARNGPLLSKMVSNIFDNNSLYQRDLQAVSSSILQVLANISDKCGSTPERKIQTPQKLTVTSKPQLHSMSAAEFQDLILFLHDTMVTLLAFLEIYPLAAETFLGSDFPVRMAGLYESIFTNMETALEVRTPQIGAMHIKDLLANKLHQSQICMLKIFRHIVFHSCLQPILESSCVGDTAHAEQNVETYISIMTTVLQEKRLVGHIQSLFPFEEDKEILMQSTYQVDDTRIKFIEDGVMEAYSVYGRICKKQDANKEVDVKPLAIKDECPDQHGAGESIDNRVFTSRKSDIELESLISAVKDLLPNLGDGFIELCLIEYNYVVEQVVSAVLDENLPRSLADQNRHMEREIPKNSSKQDHSEETYLETRKNVFDGDEFDIFYRRDIDMSRVHIGKQNADVILDDKSIVLDRKGMYEKHGSEFVEDEDLDIYDDEYDDTYDSNVVGAGDADSADELTSQRFYPNSKHATSERVEENSVDVEEEQKEETRNRDHFTADPAKLREAVEHRRALKRNVRSKEKGIAEGHDVKGKPKGQGQDVNTVHNRAWKERNRASRVNHNRKYLSDKKRR